MRISAIIACLLLLSLSSAVAQTTGSPGHTFLTESISPVLGGPSTGRELRVQGLPASSPVRIVLFDPAGNQSTTVITADSSGTITTPLSWVGGFSAPGLYRVVVAAAPGPSVSAVFVVGDGTPRLYAEPTLFSPHSALQFIGTGFPADQPVSLTVSLSNGRGDRTVQGRSDASGNLLVYVWPEQLNEPFLETGLYAVAAPSLALSAGFTVAEKPLGATLSVDGPVLPGVPVPVHLGNYLPDHYVWAVYSASDGGEGGELLLGPTDSTGSLDTSVVLPPLSATQYHLATPYDWGETTFAAVPPTATPTATATPTPTATATATPKPTPSRRRVKAKPCARLHGRKLKACRKRHHLSRGKAP